MGSRHYQTRVWTETETRPRLLTFWNSWDFLNMATYPCQTQSRPIKICQDLLWLGISLEIFKMSKLETMYFPKQLRPIDTSEACWDFKDFKSKHFENLRVSTKLLRPLLRLFCHDQLLSLGLSSNSVETTMLKFWALKKRCRHT